MSEELKPGAEVTPDVLEETKAETAETPDYSEMSLAELSQKFQELADSEDRMSKSKEAEAIKAAFYKKLSREKAAAGLETPEVPESTVEAEQTEQPEAVS